MHFTAKNIFVIIANKTGTFLFTLMVFCLLANFASGQKKPSPKHKGAPRETSNPKTWRCVFNGHKYDVYSTDFSKESIHMFWKNNDGKKLVSISNLKEYVQHAGHQLVFATNAGMFMEDNSPLGLYIENGKQLRPIKLSTKGSGNFYMQPNGVFLLTRARAMVVTSTEFDKHKAQAVFATQSGPMLVTGGTINANFTKGSANINIRSGVGITKTGKVVFAISDEWVNFYDFASLFKDSLECDNALYLDGAISKMYIPALKRFDMDGDFGAMIGVVK